MKATATWSVCCVADSGDDSCWTLIKSPRSRSRDFSFRASPRESAGIDSGFGEIVEKAADRIVAPDEVVKRNPEVIIASWCGKAMRRATIVERPGWDRICAVQAGHIYEIKSTYILQPGPAALTDGVRQLHALLAKVVGVEPLCGE